MIAVPQELQQQLASCANYDPYRLVDLQIFEHALRQSGRHNPTDLLPIATRACMVSLRELFLEMNPIYQDSYNGQVGVLCCLFIACEVFSTVNCPIFIYR